MVKIAVAGGSGQVGSEVVDALVATMKHEVTILSRKESTTSKRELNVTWRAVDFHNKNELVEALQGIHTILSFIQPLADSNNIAEKNLIDAAIIAGVSRFAPSQWGSASTIDMPWWTGKDGIQTYLKQVNENGKVINYTLFQPGLFLEYLAFPYKTATHLEPLSTMIDFQNRRAIIVDGHDATMTFTSVRDVAGVITELVNLSGEWPLTSGIRGNKVTVSQLLRIGERIRGRPFVVERVKSEDLERGILTASWGLQASHPSVDENQIEQMLKTVLIGTLLGSVKGAWDVSDEVNQLLPNYDFTQIEDFFGCCLEGQTLVKMLY